MAGDLGFDRVLIFTRTCGYRHDSIPHGVQAVTRLAADDGLAVDHTEDPAMFSEAHLRNYVAVVWLSTFGQVLSSEQRAAFASWLSSGGGFAGVHAASATETDWPDFEDMVGAFFARHPEPQQGTIRVEDHSHPATAGLPSSWEQYDEFYDFVRNPRRRVQVLLTVDETSYRGGQMGEDHPLSWATRYGDGRCWYTALGHGPELYADPTFLAHLRGGLRSVWGASRTGKGSRASTTSGH